MAGQTITKEFQTVMDENPELQAYINANPNYVPDEQMQASMVAAYKYKKVNDESTGEYMTGANGQSGKTTSGSRPRSNYRGSGTSFTYVKDRMMYGLRTTISGAVANVASNLNISNQYEMVESSRLNQAKLKQQCERFKTAWETDIENLNELSNVFSHARENSGMVGKTAETFFTVMDAYCLVIQCLQLAKSFSIVDSDTLYNRLGDEDLVGSEILKGIRDEEEEYNKECRLHDACLREAPNHQDYDPGYANWLRSEAARHGQLADNHYDAWLVYLGKKKEYEDVNAFSAGLYLTGAEYRNCAQNGMASLEKAFDGTGNYVVPDTFEGWYNDFTSLNEEKFAEYASKWKDENGDWDMDAIGETISVDDSVSILDCMALCYVLDDPCFDDPKNLELLINSGFISEFTLVDENVSTEEGSWVYRPSKTLVVLQETYKAHIDSIKSSSTDDELKHQYAVYNILYSAASIIGNSGEIHGSIYDEEVFDYVDCDHERFEFKISYNVRTYIDAAGNEQHDPYGYYTIDYGIYNIDTQQNVYTVDSESLRIYDYNSENQTSAMLDGSAWAIKESGNVDQDVVSCQVGKNAADFFIGYTPVVGDVYSLASTVLGSWDEYEQAVQMQQEKEQRDEQIINMNEATSFFERMDLQASYIYTSEGELIITDYTIADEELDEYIASYKDDEHIELKYNPYTFVEDYIFTDAEVEVDEEDSKSHQFSLFLDYVEGKRKHQNSNH